MLLAGATLTVRPTQQELDSEEQPRAAGAPAPAGPGDVLVEADASESNLKTLDQAYPQVVAGGNTCQ